jgi:signal transduction histidine kinase/CheY-like chemotaxis protein
MQTMDVEPRPARLRDREPIIAAELIRAQYANMPGAFIGSAVTASFMVAVFYDKLPARAVLPWLIAAYVSCGVRLLLWQRFCVVVPEVADMARWARYAVVSSLLAGLIWGAGGIVLNVPGNLSYQIVVLLVTTGLAFTSTYLASAYLPAYRAFVYPTFALAALPFLLGGDLWHVAVGLATLAALPPVLRYAGQLCYALRASIEVRLCNADLVEELRAQKRAADEAAKSRFLAVASHDLRQPLHSLELFVQALEDTPLPPHAQQLVGNVRRSVDSMEELFDGLLDISRLDAGVVRAREEVIALADLFERLSFEYTTIAQRKGLRLRVMKTSVYVRSDPTLLGRILRNLVANAVRYTDRGRVTVGCRRRGDRVSIEVWDTGPGIPADKCAEIFQEFTQLGNPERDRRKGLGLGLAIVERLAKLLGHSVLLRSRSGKGSVFAVSVARGRLDEQAVLEPARRICGHFDLKGRVALLIQGKSVVREELTELLRSWSCEVVAAGSLTEMMGMVGGLPRAPDLIMAEHDAHAASGIAAVELLRNEFNFEVPALLVGLTAESVEKSGEARGGIPVLYWPCNAGRLRTLISNVLHVGPAAASVRARRAS